MANDNPLDNKQAKSLNFKNVGGSMLLGAGIFGPSISTFIGTILLMCLVETQNLSPPGEEEHFWYTPEQMNTYIMQSMWIGAIIGGVIGLLSVLAWRYSEEIKTMGHSVNTGFWSMFVSPSRPIQRSNEHNYTLHL